MKSIFKFSETAQPNENLSLPQTVAVKGGDDKRPPMPPPPPPGGGGLPGGSVLPNSVYGLLGNPGC